LEFVLLIGFPVYQNCIFLSIPIFFTKSLPDNLSLFLVIDIFSLFQLFFSLPCINAKQFVLLSHFYACTKLSRQLRFWRKSMSYAHTDLFPFPSSLCTVYCH
jgi:hypothetical protein